jgi:hypothetical protein
MVFALLTHFVNEQLVLRAGDQAVVNACVLVDALPGHLIRSLTSRIPSKAGERPAMRLSRVAKSMPMISMASAKSVAFLKLNLDAKSTVSSTISRMYQSFQYEELPLSTSRMSLIIFRILVAKLHIKLKRCSCVVSEVLAILELENSIISEAILQVKSRSRASALAARRQ